MCNVSSYTWMKCFMWAFVDRQHTEQSKMNEFHNTGMGMFARLCFRHLPREIRREGMGHDETILTSTDSHFYTPLPPSHTPLPQPLSAPLHTVPCPCTYYMLIF